MDNQLDAVVDIETCGTSPGAVIVSIGITRFSRNEKNTYQELVDKGLTIPLNTEVQVAEGQIVDPRTMAWWKKQGEEARKALNPENPVHPRDFYSLIEEKIGNPYLTAKMRWYARGPVFDMCLLENMWNRFGVSPPWAYWNVRDSRTVYDEYGLDYRAVKQPDEMVMHDALYDAAWDAYMLQRVHEPTYLLDLKDLYEQSN